MSSFASRLRRLRERKGMTQKDIANHFQLGESTVSMYEQGKREPDFDLLERIADYFEVSTDYLLGRTDQRNNVIQQHEDPIVQVLMRGKDQMSSKNYDLFTKAVEELKKAYMDKVDRELDGDK